jgi:hypothetical protein
VEAPPPADEPPVEEPPVEEPPVEEPPEEGASTEVPPSEAAPGPPSEAEIAAAAEVLVTARTRRQLATALAWNAMILLAVLLAVAAIALTVAGVLGAEL